MGFIIVGTAGHVDHGKTLLVKALTGVDTDRLKEEKKRGISIVLGFAPLKLPSGRRLGLVDVPGHERFVHHMLAGVGGMDLVMLVVAADEGIMPQTREHLAIIDLLKVKKGLIVLNKIDLVDKEWLELVEEEVREAVKGTVLEGAPIVPVSALTGEGVPDLLRVLEELASQTPPRSPHGWVRLPIDRVFTITGFGTVVTGTLWSGTIHLGDELEIQPQGLLTRVRNLQVHGENVKEALAGQRVAVNLTGVEKETLERGSTLLTPGVLRPTRRIDASFRLLKEARPLPNRSRIRFYLGTGEAMGRIVLLDREEMRPGEEALVQLQLEEPVVASRGDRFILRSYSPLQTIGGGVVIDPLPSWHKRFDEKILLSLEKRREGTPAEILEQLLQEGRGILSGSELTTRLALTREDVKDLLKEEAQKGKIIILEGDNEVYALNPARYEEWWQVAERSLRDFHQQYPLRPGLSKEELRSRHFSRLSPRIFQTLLERWQQEGRVILSGGLCALPQFKPQLSPDQEDLARSLTRYYREAWWQPPTLEETAAHFNVKREELEEIIHYLVREGVLVRVGEEFCWHREALQEAIDKIKGLGKGGPFTLGEARDLLQSSRKYVLPLLEYLDQIKVTKRIGDKRIILG
ncbi:MAG TPA: selenocysteine-specific translation elongation factor [Moorella mulderi]|nr:selenocysteine-specific translation elongation factor [Moorella mulderi]